MAKSRRKTFKKKKTAKAARKKGQNVYKCKGGYRLTKIRRKKARKKARKRRRRR